MHCINVMPRALRPGAQQGATICIGAKAPILDGAQFATMVIPFIEINKENDFEEVVDVIEKVWDWWMEEGKNRERIGETLKRLGFAKLLEVTGTKADPRHVKEPRHNPYIFWKEEEVDGGWQREISDYRSRHQK